MSIKEALERIKRTALDAKPEDVPKALAHIVRLCIDADRTLVESGDVRENQRPLTDKEWSEKHDIVCHAPDGADRCEGCPHYYGRSKVCVYTSDFVDARERIVQIIDPDFDPQLRQNRRMIAQRAADAILATGLVPDEVAIRADERERCAKIADCIADEYDATSFTSTNADQVAALRSKEQAAHEIAAAIRAGRGE